MQTVYKVLLAVAGLCAAAVLGILALGAAVPVGPFAVGGFAALAVGVRAHPVLKDFTFTLFVFASVTLAMFYPGLLDEWGGVELTIFIVPLIQIIMFGMGASLSVDDFARVIQMPRGVIVGVLCQFTIMPLVGLTLATTLGVPDEIAAGIVLIGSAPSGVASNVMAYISESNLALSVTLTSVATLLAPVMTPFLMKMLAGQFVPVEFWAMMWSIVKMIIAPVALGLLFNRYAHGKAEWLDEIMPIISMVAITVIIAVITAAGQESLLQVGGMLVAAAIVHNATGYLLGYWICRLIGMSEQDCRTISFEVGMQNGGLASGIAVEMGKVATVGLAPAIFGPWMNITGSALANYWRRDVLTEESVEAATAE
ncbi:MAG: bile acid:sodium symporter family protein [Salinivenus sp.]